MIPKNWNQDYAKSCKANENFGFDAYDNWNWRQKLEKVLSANKTICIQLFQRLPLFWFILEKNKNKREKIFINSYHFNVEEIDHIPLQSMLIWNSELCVFVCFVSALSSFSINCLHPFHHEYKIYVRYGNDNVILFIRQPFEKWTKTSSKQQTVYHTNA